MGYPEALRWQQYRLCHHVTQQLVYLFKIFRVLDGILCFLFSMCVTTLNFSTPNWLIFGLNKKLNTNTSLYVFERSVCICNHNNRHLLAGSEVQRCLNRKWVKQSRNLSHVYFPKFILKSTVLYLLFTHAVRSSHADTSRGHMQDIPQRKKWFHWS